MSKASLTRSLIICAAVAACADASTIRTMTAPGTGSARSESSSDLPPGTTVDAPFEVDVTGEATPASQAGTQLAASAQQVATDGRASGHVGFNFSVPTLGISTEQYSFVALSTESTPPFAATGQYELLLTAATGVVQKFHGNVVCMSRVGNTTRIAGQITKVWVNNIQRPINAATHNYWTVTDNGEGQGAVDAATLMYFNNALGAQFHCSTGITRPQFPNQAGDIQVQP